MAECRIYLNNNGKGDEVAKLIPNYSNSLELDSKYIKNLSIYYEICQKATFFGTLCCDSCRNGYYEVSDDDGNKGILVREMPIMCTF